MDGMDAVVIFAHSIRNFQSRSSFVHAFASGLTTKKDDNGVDDNTQITRNIALSRPQTLPPNACLMAIRPIMITSNRLSAFETPSCVKQTEPGIYITYNKFVSTKQYTLASHAATQWRLSDDCCDLPRGWLQLSCGFCEYLASSSSRMLLRSWT